MFELGLSGIFSCRNFELSLFFFKGMPGLSNFFHEIFGSVITPGFCIELGNYVRGY